MKRIRFAILPLAVILCATGILAAQTTPAANEPPVNTPGFAEFGERVKAYTKLHGNAESSVYSPEKTDQPEAIAAGQQGLVKSIRDMRPDAKQGDIFTAMAAGEFKAAIKTAFSGAAGAHTQATLDQGDPLKGFKVQVNQVYPSGLPFTTVPPTVLLKLPRLPDEVAYRILGQALLLVDLKANLIVDFIPNAVP